MSEFAERVGIIVGGANGIGRALASTLAKLGARIAIVDVGCASDGHGSDALAAARAADELAHEGAVSFGISLDSSHPDSAQAMIEATKSALGRVDFGVYAAGFHHDRALLRASEQELEHVLGVHLLGAMRFARELARVLIADRRPGSIALATSASGFFGSAGQSALAAASGGLVGFVRTAATELRRHEVRINAVIPTARTRLTEKLPLFESIRPDSLTPEHVAQAIAYLLSDAARDVHGEAIGVAGGRIYSFRHIETSGAFLDGPPPTLAEIDAAWRDVTRR